MKSLKYKSPLLKVVKADRGGEICWRVEIGPYKSIAEADKAQSRVERGLSFRIHRGEGIILFPYIHTAHDDARPDRPVERRKNRRWEGSSLPFQSHVHEALPTVKLEAVRMMAVANPEGFAEGPSRGAAIPGA